MAHNAMYKNAITIISFLTGAAVLTYLWLVGNGGVGYNYNYYYYYYHSSIPYT